MVDSILDSVKNDIGGGSMHSHFDDTLINCINAVFVDLRQIGVGPPTGFMITGSTETWSDYLGNDLIMLGSVPELVSIKARLLFDPPSGSVATELNNRKDEMTWRLAAYTDTNI